MFDDLHDTGALVARLASTDLDELRVLHGRFVDAERIVRAVIREREALARRNERLLKARELALVSE